MPSISSAFTAAVANSNQGRHERYAAHIPVNRGDNSGRQSAASQDSTQSEICVKYPLNGALIFNFYCNLSFYQKIINDKYFCVTSHVEY
uniref:Uncharacterized protein n=1 Tax=Heterorhabditis bacteriophora TaxID=37862 RepID=A0A1I7WUJ7_HETBA